MWPGAFQAPILLHQIQALQREVKPGLVGVFQQHEFALRAVLSYLDLFQALVASYAVVPVHHVVAHLQVTEIRE